MSRVLVDSGIKWIGKYPDEWNLFPLRAVVENINEKNNPIKFTNVLSLTNKLGVVPYEEKGNQGNISKEDISQYKIAYKDTVIINSMNLKIGSVGYSNYDGCVSPVYYVLKNNKKSDIRFINYIFQSNFQKYLSKYGKGILEIREKISMYDVLHSYVPIPSLKEQKRIADYLDEQCTKNDEIINDNNHEIELIEEYKKSLISKATLKGIDSTDFNEVDSEWIKYIPSDWKMNNIKAKYSFRKGLSITKDDLQEDGCKVISYGQIHSKDNNGTRIVDKLVRYIPNTCINQTNSAVELGDHIFADTSEDLEGCGNNVYVDLKEPIFAGYHTIILHDKEDKHSRYFGYLFQTDEWRSQIRKSVYGVKLYSITQKILKSTSILIPPYNVQEQIVNYLDKQCAGLEEIIEYRKQIIEKLEEYKRSLIYECVTGKREV